MSTDSKTPSGGDIEKEGIKEEAGSWLNLDANALKSDESQSAEFINEQGAYAESNYARVRSRAQKGDVEAQFELCMRYHFGQSGVEQDNEASYRWCYEAAKQGHAWALMNLGWMYESGAGTERDDAKAADAYRAAAAKELPEAMVWFGQMLEQGRGVDENATTAFEWYSRAADAGDANGQYNVALCHQFGKGVDKDENIAVTWYEKAADQQHIEALYNLGWLYSQGRGVVKDTNRAKELFNIAAGRSDTETDELIIEAMDYDEGKGGVNKDQVKSHALYLQAAKKDSSTAMFTVGINYEYGRGTEKSWEKALQWYKKAANKGHPEANFRYRFRQLIASGEAIRFFRYSGVVGLGGHGIESGRGTSGVIGQFGRGKSSVATRRKKIKGTRFYLDTDLGDRVEVDIPHRPDALYSQQRVSLIYAIKKGKSTGPYMLLVNHDTDDHAQTLTSSHTFWDEQMVGTNHLVGLCLFIITIGLPFFIGSAFQQEGELSTNYLLHPFNWILFVPLALSFGFWIKWTLSRRNRGVQTVRRRMAEIKAWIKHSSRIK